MHVWYVDAGIEDTPEPVYTHCLVLSTSLHVVNIVTVSVLPVLLYFCYATLPFCFERVIERQNSVQKHYIKLHSNFTIYIACGTRLWKENVVALQ